MPTEYVALDARAVRASVDLVARVSAADLTRPTPCAAWTLHGLLAHMTTQHHGFASAARGENDMAAWRLRPLGDDPVGAYRTSAEHVLAAFAAEDLPERRVHLPELSTDRTFPAAQAVSFHFIDYVVHSWDVARTLGTTVDFDDDLLDAALTVAEAVPGGTARTAPGAAFGPEATRTSQAPLDRIVAILGRSPTWPD